MDPRTNPYAPGAGTPPPELAGRDAAIEQAAVALDRIRDGRAARSVIFYGLRGVGKTVLLNQIRVDAEARGIVAVSMEAPEERSLPALLAPSLRAALLRLDRGEALKAGTRRALSALAGFISRLKIKYQDIELAMDVPPEAGLADSGDLDNDLGDLIVTVGEAAAGRKTAIVLFIDELQYVPEDQLAALIMALHNATSQKQLPVTMVAAGLPQLFGRMGRAKSYSERLFEFVSIGRLDAEAATAALCVQLRRNSGNPSSDRLLPVLPAGMGQAQLERRRAVAYQSCGREAREPGSDQRTRRKFLSRTVRSPDTLGETLHARDGRTGARSASLRRGRGSSPEESDDYRANTKRAHHKRHDLQPGARRHRLHGAALRRLHEADHS